MIIIIVVVVVVVVVVIVVVVVSIRWMSYHAKCRWLCVCLLSVYLSL